MFDNMKEAARHLGKPAWREMLLYSADLHERCVHPAEGVFPYPWEEIGTGYVYRPAFGHWDIVHSIMDTVPYETEHARQQLLNDLANQEDNGLIPGSIYLRNGSESTDTTTEAQGKCFVWSKEFGHPPMWIYAADSVYSHTQDKQLLIICLNALKRQLIWFQTNRRAENGGYFYLDILTHQWESGVDEGVRFLHSGDSGGRKHACIDATAHVYGMLDMYVKWSNILGLPATEYISWRDNVRMEINALYDEKQEWFFDSWDIKRPERQVESFEGMFPMVCGAATTEQARGVRNTLMNPNKFNTKHPIATVSADSPYFEKRMWRGPAWNSMTMWAVFGLLRYGYREDAAHIAEKALDASAEVFAKTGKIWEFYDSLGGDPRSIARKPSTSKNMPCDDYMGHAPLFWLARVFEGVV